MEFGKTFANNDIYTSKVIEGYILDESIFVITYSPGSVKEWALAQVTYFNEYFYHKSLGTFFELTGAAKEVLKLLNDDEIELLGETIDDFT